MFCSQVEIQLKIHYYDLICNYPVIFQPQVSISLSIHGSPLNMIKIADNPLEHDFIEKVRSFFGSETPLAASDINGRKYEERPQQCVMAEAVASGLIDGEHLCVEAPTGVGKSFAYLIPAILFSRLKEQPVVISTNTIALQEQLINRDIPILRKLVGMPFTAALAKGRENYICLGRLKNAVEEQQTYLPFNELMPEVLRIAKWAQVTHDGSRSDLHFIPSAQTWGIVCSELGTCPYGADAKTQQDCFFLKARQSLYSADLIVTNHALFSVDLAMRMYSDNKQSILPDYSAVVIDEAHCFEDIASTHLGFRISSAAVMFLLNRLYNPRIDRGLLIKSHRIQARQAAIAARERARQFFSNLFQWLQGQGRPPLVYNESEHIPNLLTESWIKLEDELGIIIDSLDPADGYTMELTHILTRLSDIRKKIDKFLTKTLQDCVYWFEYRNSKSRNISFHIVPIEVSRILKEVLFKQGPPVVLTSATLSFKNDLTYFQMRVGADSARTLILDSPFDYKNQMELFVPFSTMPEPNDGASYVETICEQIKHFVMKSQGKAFVLFTNYGVMNEAATKLDEFFRTNHFHLIVQGRELPRSQMLELFRKDVSSVLFGTDSFWMGVDVPGESLSNVIIVKLPFAVPTHPLISAKVERIRQKGGNPFWDYSLPEAVIKFRQGIGRLIRKKDDKGMVVVLDSRIVRTRYGKVFLESIPDCQRHLF